MGDTVSVPNLKDKYNYKPIRGFTVVCDDCGTLFYVSHEIISGQENKKRCSR